MVEFLKRYIFTTQGRINRLQFLKYSLGTVTVYIAVSLILQLVASLISGGTDTMLTHGVEYVTTLVWFFAYLAIAARRLHDLNRPDFWVIGTIIPLVNLLLSLYLLFAPGTIGRNNYGEEPRA